MVSVWYLRVMLPVSHDDTTGTFLYVFVMAGTIIVTVAVPGAASRLGGIHLPIIVTNVVSGGASR